MKNKLVKILSVVSIVCVLVCCFAFSSSASFEPSEEVIDSLPSYYSNDMAEDGMLYFYYLEDNLKDYSHLENIQFVSNGIKFDRIISGDGDIYFSNDELNLKICEDGVYLDNGSWRHVTIFTGSPSEISYVRTYFSNRTFQNPNWQNALEFTFVRFSPFENVIYFDTLCRWLSTRSISFGVNARLSLNGSDVEARVFDNAVLTGNLHESFPHSLVFVNSSTGDTLAFNLFDDLTYLNWTNLVLYLQPSDYSGFYLINLLTFIGNQAIADFPYYLYEDRELDESWEYYNVCDINYSGFKPLVGRFYSSYGLPKDGTPLKLDAELCINSRGVLCSKNYPNDADTPWFDNFTIIPYGDYISCGSSFYWLFDYLTVDAVYQDQSITGSESFTFISSTPPSDVDMFYNSFGFFYGYCGFIINGVQYKYFEYSSIEEKLYFYGDVNDSTGEPGFPDFEILVEDFYLYSCVLPPEDFVGKSFYQFVVLNMNRVGADISADVQAAYEEGKRVGYAEGVEYASSKYSVYEDIGYNKGFEAAKKIYDEQTDGGIIGRLLSAPGDAFDKLVIYDSGGLVISIWDVFTTLICACLFIWFLKMFAGG